MPPTTAQHPGPGPGPAPEQCPLSPCTAQHRQIPSALREAWDWLAAHYADHDVKAGMVAAAGIPARELAILCNQYFGQSPAQLIRQFRVRQARFVLWMNPCLSISQVAAQVGFTHPGHFAGYFRDHYGRTPSADRERARAVHIWRLTDASVSPGRPS